jgi:hypothetical protein
MCNRNVLIPVYAHASQAHNHAGTLQPLCSNSDSSSSSPNSSCRPLPCSSKARSVSTSAAASNADEGADDDEADAKPGKPLRVERLLANLGYGKRKECTVMIKRKQLVFADTGQPAKVSRNLSYLFHRACMQRGMQRCTCSCAGAHPQAPPQAQSSATSQAHEVMQLLCPQAVVCINKISHVMPTACHVHVLTPHVCRWARRPLPASCC